MAIIDPSFLQLCTDRDIAYHEDMRLRKALSPLLPVADYDGPRCDLMQWKTYALDPWMLPQELEVFLAHIATEVTCALRGLTSFYGITQPLWDSCAIVTIYVPHSVFTRHLFAMAIGKGI